MSEAHRSDAHDAGSDRDAKIEQLLLVGLDHYFAARYELAINVWTRALFLDRSHARARAYIDRARSAQAERQRESEELLQNGVAAFERGEGVEARRLLRAAIDGGAPPDEALAVLDRMDRLESAAPAVAPARSRRLRRARAPREAAQTTRSFAGTLGLVTVMLLVTAIVAVAGVAAWKDVIDWRSLVTRARVAARSEPLPAVVAIPVARETPLAPPRRGEMALNRARTLAATGHLHEAMTALEWVRATDAQQPDADRLRADIQRQLLALTSLPSGAAPDREKGE